MNRGARQERNALYFFWQALCSNRNSFMGIGRFKREVHRWLTGSLLVAQQDAESASRMPTDVDPVGIIDQRVVDAVEDSLLESGSRSRANTARRTYAIQHQAPLTNSEISAMYGLGYNLIRRMMNDGQEITNNRPFEHVSRSVHARSARSSAPVAATASNIVNADTATAADQVIEIVQDPELCRICLEPENEEDGPLLGFGVVCDHVFHTQCIMRWIQTNPAERRSCPVCRQSLSDLARGTTPATPTSPPQSGSIELCRICLDPELGRICLDSLRRSTIEEHIAFIDQLGLVDRLPTPVRGPGSELLRREEAACFAARWFQTRDIDVGDYFNGNSNTNVTRNEDDGMATYWIEFRLAESRRYFSMEQTAEWETAFHGSNMSCLYSILRRRFLDTGPRAKKSNRHGGKYQYGVYCHKHGTRKKAANYMKYFEYQGFIAAPLLQLKVHDYIACGDQWCCDPSGVQIESVWIHIVPIRSVGLRRYYIVASQWQSAYELCPISGPARSRYSVAERPER